MIQTYIMLHALWCWPLVVFDAMVSDALKFTGKTGDDQ